MGKTYRNVKAPSDSVSMYGSLIIEVSQEQKRHSHHSIRCQNKNKNINEENFQTFCIKSK